jgi:hypothetical protein
MKTILKIFFTIFIFYFSICISAFSQNLVPNPSFEDTICCPHYECQVSCAMGWNTYSATPDYCNSCDSPPNYSVPHNGAGFQYAATGDAYCAFYTYCWVFDNYREYIGTQLINPLVTGKKYYVSFKVSLADEVYCGTNNIGVLFSTVPHIDTLPYDTISGPINNFAHIYCPLVITEKNNWVNISGSFFADSSYKYVILGNFFSDDNTIISTLNYCNAYYFVDDICVSEDSSTCDIQTDIVRYKYNKINIYPNPTKDKLFIENYSSKEFIFNIYNHFGVKVKNGKSYHHSYTEIDLSNLQSGIYYIQCFINNNLLTKKFILIN